MCIEKSLISLSSGHAFIILVSVYYIFTGLGRLLLKCFSLQITKYLLQKAISNAFR